MATLGLRGIFLIILQCRPRVRYIDLAVYFHLFTHSCVNTGIYKMETSALRHPSTLWFAVASVGHYIKIDLSDHLTMMDNGLAYMLITTSMGYAHLPNIKTMTDAIYYRVIRWGPVAYFAYRGAHLSWITRQFSKRAIRPPPELPFTIDVSAKRTPKYQSVFTTDPPVPVR